MKFFSLDSAFHKYGTILFDLIMLNIFWSVITLVSFGFLSPLTNAALFNSVHHTFLEEDGYMMRSFFSVFRHKLLRGLALSALGTLMYLIAGFNIWSIVSGFFNVTFLLPLYLIILAEVILTLLYASALLAHTDMRLKLLLKYGFLFSIKHFGISFACLVAIIGLGYVCLYYSPLLLIVIIAPLFYYLGWMIYSKVFEKYYLDKLL